AAQRQRAGHAGGTGAGWGLAHADGAASLRRCDRREARPAWAQVLLDRRRRARLRARRGHRLPRREPGAHRRHTDPSGPHQLPLVRRARRHQPGVAMSGAAGAPRRLAAALALLLVAGCAPTVLRHRVQPGENLFRIGKAYGVSYQELARRNHISDPDRIEVGAIVVIPHATRELPVDEITPDQARGDQPLARELRAGPSHIYLPVTGAIASPFGPRGDGHHDGIDISCPEGTPVRAARGGRVLYADTLRGYGNLVIVEHDQGYATVYAH